jgi:hypothetical protein
MRFSAFFDTFFYYVLLAYIEKNDGIGYTQGESI